jgi:16S rRNA (guanine1207-N2)-methyltransferase
MGTGGSSILLGTGPGDLAVALGRRFPDSQLCLMDISWTKLHQAENMLQTNRVQNARIEPGIDLPAGTEGETDVVVIELPKGRKLARRWLLQAYSALRPGGYLYLGGANDQGIRSVAQDARQLFKNGSVLGYKKGCRVVRMVKPAGDDDRPEWAGEPGIAPGTWFEIRFDNPPGLSPLVSLPGVFSYDHLDEASLLLLDNLRILAGSHVLDLGCGYGILGLYAAQAGAAQVDLLDDNQLAVACTRRNILRHGLEQANAVPSDAASLAANPPYQFILTNPPFHTGKAVDYAVTQAFIEQSFPLLAPGGQFWMVANRFIRYEALLDRVFGNSRLIVETPKYQVWLALRR